ncbi:MAG: TIGR00341 family protein [Saprospiraceae bacterium]
MRLFEIIIEDQNAESVEKLLDKDYIIERWSYTSENGKAIIKVLIQDENGKELLALLEKKSNVRVIIYPIAGTLPVINNHVEKEENSIKIGKFFAITKEELRHVVDEPVNLSMNFILMVVLSSFVAGIGILKVNIAVIIGAMVIAPFLGPNVSMAFGTTLGEWPIIKKSIITGVCATIIVVVISMIWGFSAKDISSISLDPSIGYQDVILALVCGFAGVISVISGQGTTLVGVMVAAALLPPLMRGGLLLGGGNYSLALNSLLIFSTNIICLNIAGIITFYLAGITPGRWWEKEKAKKKTRTAFIIWFIALVMLLAVIITIRRLG